MAKNHLMAGAITLAFSSALFSYQPAQAVRCEFLHNDTTTQILTKKMGALPQIKTIKVKLSENSDPQNKPFLQFGFESEYTLDTAAPLLKIYAPRAEFGVSRAEWNAMTDAQRLEWFKGMVAKRAEHSKDSGLVKISEKKEEEFLPETLVYDETKNLEIVLDPVDSPSILVQQIKYVNTNFGLGSMQGMISVPKDTFYQEGPSKKAGYFTFVADMDILEKLSIGATRFRADPTKEVAKPFLHPYLGPMSAEKQGIMSNYLRMGFKDHAEGRIASLTKEVLALVATSDNSFKYVGSTAFRPDIGGRLRISTEVRDAHVSEGLLLEKIHRISYFLQRGMGPFEKFSNISSFDRHAEFKKLPAETQLVLLEIFPTKDIYIEAIGQQTRAVPLEYGMNFSFPMRNWNSYLINMGREKDIPAIETAQRRYADRVSRIALAYRTGRITKEQARAQIQGELSLFAADSGLAEIFKNYYNSQIL